MVKEYKVRWIRSQGLKAKWSKTRHGKPIIIAFDDRSRRWVGITREMWADVDKFGLVEAFKNHTALLDFFSVPL